MAEFMKLMLSGKWYNLKKFYIKGKEYLPISTLAVSGCISYNGRALGC